MALPIILDVDTGIDDALAIAYAAASPEIDLLGVTVTYGNTPGDKAYRNTVEILRLLKSETPVFMGAEKPLQRTKAYTSKFHGSDGVGDTLGEVTVTQRSSVSAVDFIIEQVHRYGRGLTIVTTGPLTNLAKAIVKDPSIVGLVGKVVSMGGAFMAPGNRTKFAEANLYMDPEAADIVVRSELPLTMVGLDVTRKTLLSTGDMLRWRAKGTEMSLFFAAMTEFYLKAYQQYYPYLKGCALHDPLAVAVAKQPAFVRTVPMFIQVDLEEDSLGRTTEDVYRTQPAAPTSQVCVQVEAEAFMADFYTCVERAMACH